MASPNPNPPRPLDCTTCGQTHPRGCKGHRDRARSVPCRNWPRRGADVCDAHGGNAPQVLAKAAIRTEVASWRLGDPTADPGEIMLRLVTQSATRADLYADLLQQAYEAAERLAAAYRGDTDITIDGEHADADAERARKDLERIFNHGGVAALIGHTYNSTKDGDIFATGEKIRGLADLENQERDRCMNFAAKAVAAGLAERMVRATERQVDMFVAALNAAFAEMGLAADLAQEAKRRVAGHLRLAAG